MSVTSKKPGMIICAIAVVAFVAFAGLTTYSINNLTDRVEGSIVANDNGVPADWSGLAVSTSTSSVTDAEAKDGYIIYTTSISNQNQTDPVSITHIASYIDGETRGFAPLSLNSLEYSYYPDSSNSWTPVAVTAPGEGENDFKLDTEIYLGPASSSNNTVYFRYYVAPSQSGLVNDKVAFVTRTAADTSELTVSDNAIAYEEATTSEVVAVADEPREVVEDESGEAAFTEPLGAVSESPSATVISAATIGAITISAEVITGSVIVLIACLGIFAASLIAYLISKKKEERRRRLY